MTHAIQFVPRKKNPLDCELRPQVPELRLEFANRGRGRGQKQANGLADVRPETLGEYQHPDN